MESIYYIQHRLSKVTKGAPLLFDQKALHRIFRYTGGMPLKINVTCNRALIETFKRRGKRITDEIAKEAIRYLSNSTTNVSPKFFKSKLVVWMAAGCCLLLIITGGFYFYKNTPVINLTEQTVSKQPTIVKIPSPESSPEVAMNFSTDADGTSMSKDVFVKAEQMENMQLPAKSFKEDVSGRQALSSKMTHSVQVGAFRNPNYAEELIMQLKAKGYWAQMFQKNDSKGRIWHTVRIGDYTTREKAQKKADAFSAIENMPAAIVPFGKL